MLQAKMLCQMAEHFIFDTDVLSITPIQKRTCRSLQVLSIIFEEISEQAGRFCSVIPLLLMF